MTDLDDQNSYTSPDSLQSAIDSIDAFPKQLEQAWGESSKIEFPEKYKAIDNVVISGMGGSRFTPLSVLELFKEQLKLPCTITDNYTLPGYVGKNSLVILSSYSGTTEEVVTCGKEAIRRGALVTAVTAGGELAQMLEEINAPFYQFDPKHNPSGQPRIGVGYMIGGHIGIAHTTGIIEVEASEVDKAISQLPELLRTNTISTPTDENSAKQIAKVIHHKYPYVITAEFLQGFGNAMANALNETAKSISSPRVIPELNHHMMEGLQFPKELHDIGLFVFFFSKLYHDRVQKRFHITKEIVEKNELETYWHELSGETKIAQLFEAIGLGSYVTMYLSVLHGVDPNQIPWVDAFKQKLKE